MGHDVGGCGNSGGGNNNHDHDCCHETKSEQRDTHQSESKHDCGPKSESKPGGDCRESQRSGFADGSSRESRGGGNDRSDRGFEYLAQNSFCRPGQPPRSPMPTVPESPFGPDPGFQLPWKPPISDCRPGFPKPPIGCWPSPRQPIDTPPWLCPKPEARVFTDNSTCPPKTVVDAGDGDDNIRVSCDPCRPGGVIVDVNGEKHHLTPEQARNLEIRGGKGNDTIIVDPDVKVGNWFDRLTNRGITLDGGDGDDFIVGGGGNDTIRGGRGDDIILGGDGDDRINGGDGDDLIMDWSGNNRMRGGRGRDTVIGGRDLDDWRRIAWPLRA